jgi:hypothetical protein
MTRVSPPVVMVVVGFSLGACVDVSPGDSGSREPETSVATQALLPCDDVLICPGNSDILGALGPYELSTNPADVSPRGFQLLSIKKGGIPLAVFQVAGASLSGALPGPIMMPSAPDFVGTRFRIRHTSGQEIDLIIEAYQQVPFFDATKISRIMGFMIKYQMISPIRGDREDLCPYKDELGSGLARTWAIFWKGERYNPDTGEIFASGLGNLPHNVGDWFNISCAGEATIKMLRDEIGTAVTPGSPLDLSQATLNMWTAKYCPDDATRYTKLGQRVSWDDTWSSAKLGLTKSYEAIWTPDGAACLDVPRMVSRSEVLCEIPTCKEMVDDWDTHGHLITGNPLLLVIKPAP